MYFKKYLSEEEIIKESGLHRSDFIRLKESRLIVPNSENQYKSHLLSWCKKLNHLITHGWNIEVIKVWASNRSKLGEPKTWPPDLEYWKDKYTSNNE